MCLFCHSGDCSSGNNNDFKGSSCKCGSFGRILIKALFCILLVYLIVYVGTLARNNIKKFNYIGKADRMQNTININGEGKVTGMPDIAVTDIGLVTEKADVASAQKENTEKMNKLIVEIKKNGIVDADIQTTQYNINPKYNYTDGGSTITGYTVSQSVTLKIRDLTKIKSILAKVGEVGVNQVSSLNFTIDNMEKLRAEARVKALENVKTKAIALANALGVKLVRVVSFNDYSQDNASPVYGYKSFAEATGGSAPSPSPDVQTGSLEIKVNVNVVYEIE